MQVLGILSSVPLPVQLNSNISILHTIPSFLSLSRFPAPSTFSPLVSTPQRLWGHPWGVSKVGTITWGSPVIGKEERYKQRDQDHDVETHKKVDLSCGSSLTLHDTWGVCIRMNKSFWMWVIVCEATSNGTSNYP